MCCCTPCNSKKVRSPSPCPALSCPVLYNLPSLSFYTFRPSVTQSLTSLTHSDAQGSTPPSELHRLGMSLRALPKEPTLSQLHAKASKLSSGRNRFRHPNWADYLSVLSLSLSRSRSLSLSLSRLFFSSSCRHRFDFFSLSLLINCQ